LDTLAVQLRLSANEILFSEGKHARSIYLLTDGFVRRYRIARDGRRHIVGFAVPGDFVAIPQSDRKLFSAEAIGDVTVSKISRSRFFELAQLSPALLRLLLVSTTRDLDFAYSHVALLGRTTPVERILSFLLMWRDRLGPKSTEIWLPMKRGDIADYLGLSIETVSRTLTKLDSDKLIVLNRNHIRLIDPAQVATAAGLRRQSSG